MLALSAVILSLSLTALSVPARRDLQDDVVDAFATTVVESQTGTEVISTFPAAGNPTPSSVFNTDTIVSAQTRLLPPEQPSISSLHAAQSVHLTVPDTHQALINWNTT